MTFKPGGTDLKVVEVIPSCSATYKEGSYWHCILEDEEITQRVVHIGRHLY